MLEIVKGVFGLLSNKQKNKLYKLQVLVVLMALAEITGLALIGPFMSVVSDIEQLKAGGWLAQVYSYFPSLDPYGFVYYFGLALLLVLAVSAGIAMFTVWKLSLFAQRIGAELSGDLYKYYLNRPWIFHTNTNSSHLIKQIATEANRVTGSLIFPLVQLGARLVVVVVIASTVIAINPKVAGIILLVFVSIYLLLFKVVRYRLVANGKVVSSATAERYKLMSEGFGGIKDVLLSGRQEFFTSQYNQASEKFAYSQGTNLALSQVPRYFMELLAFSAVIGLALFLIRQYEGNLESVLPMLAIYGFAGLKLLPSFQQMYAYVAQIKGNLAAFDAIREDLESARREQDGVLDRSESQTELHMKESLMLRSVSFRYPNEERWALNDISLTIPRCSMVAFVGSSGSGKSTLVNLILGLIKPEKGCIELDDSSVHGHQMFGYGNLVGYVPQKIFLSDASIAENIAFGVNVDDIDQGMLDRAMKLAHVDEFVANLPLGRDTTIGEGGVQLSGGQQQRLGIARALYHNPEVLIFDEATSALDNFTEKQIMNAVYELSEKMTVILIAHRLSTVMRCDHIYMMEAGCIVDSGGYDELMSRSDKFRKMALIEN